MGESRANGRASDMTIRRNGSNGHAGGTGGERRVARRRFFTARRAGAVARPIIIQEMTTVRSPVFFRPLILTAVLLVACLRLPPNLVYQIHMDPEPALLDETAYYFDPEDSTTVFQQDGVRVKLRMLSDQALNQEYARYTFREPNLNPFTYGRVRDLNLGYTPPRFTVLQMTVVNQSHPKVMVDPARMELRTDRGEVFGYWEVRRGDSDHTFEEYYMRLRGAGGNEDAYYAERIGLAREALYRRHTFVYQGDLYTGKVVFHPLHPDVRAVEVHIPDIVLRVDRFDRPTETVDATFHFQVRQGAVPAAADED